MRYRLRSFLILALGLAAAAGAYGQGALRAGAVVKDLHGVLTVQTGGNAPQVHKPGTGIPVGSILRTGADSSVMLVFPDGQVCALAANSTVRLTRYVYAPKEPSKNEMSINLVSGGMRCVAGAIAQSHPAGARMQVGVVTLSADPGAPQTDATVVLVDGSLAVISERGAVVALQPSGQPQQIAAGQGLILGQDGTLIRDTAAKIVQQLDALPQGPEMRKQFAALDSVSQDMAVTVIMLSAPEAAEKLLVQLENLPPPEQAAPQLLFGTAYTPPTGAGGGGLPCGASCN